MVNLKYTKETHNNTSQVETKWKQGGRRDSKSLGTVHL